MRLTAITWDRLADALAERVTRAGAGAGAGSGSGSADGWRRVLVDGAPAARPGHLAAALTDALRLRGRAAVTVAAEGFWRAASLRYEYGRNDPDAYYDHWLDTGALWREVVGPLEPGGTGRVLPDLWDPDRDRATRSAPVLLPPGGVLVLHGALLLGHGFPADLAVHVSLGSSALARRTDPDERWTLPAFARYEDEVRPAEHADVVVRADDPRRPAWNGEG
ncbi:uridine kinase [Streptomyces sp. 4N509B]|uniref:uridine kinase n=1 Tax=Streptomyces sp. 4N509B TaxID=3457413 RepID=UPI003FD61A3C